MDIELIINSVNSDSLTLIINSKIEINKLVIVIFIFIILTELVELSYK